MAWCEEAAARERGRVTVRKGLDSTGAPLPMMLEGYQDDSHESVLGQFAVQTSKDDGDLDATSGRRSARRRSLASLSLRGSVERMCGAGDRLPLKRSPPRTGLALLVQTKSAAAYLVPGDSGHDAVDEGDEDGDVGEVVTPATDEFPGVAFLAEDDVLVDVLEEPPDG